MNNRIFLGGTCNNSTWRKRLIDIIEVDFFNPVVENWTHGCQQIEVDEKTTKCNIHLYVITKEMTGVFSIAEVIDSVNRKNIRTLFHVIPDGFDNGQIKSLEAVVELVNLRGGIAYMDNNIERTACVINSAFGEGDGLCLNSHCYKKK